MKLTNIQGTVVVNGVSIQEGMEVVLDDHVDATNGSFDLLGITYSSINTYLRDLILVGRNPSEKYVLQVRR